MDNPVQGYEFLDLNDPELTDEDRNLLLVVLASSPQCQGLELPWAEDDNNVMPDVASLTVSDDQLDWSASPTNVAIPYAVAPLPNLPPHPAFLPPPFYSSGPPPCHWLPAMPAGTGEPVNGGTSLDLSSEAEGASGDEQPLSPTQQPLELNIPKDVGQPSPHSPPSVVPSPQGQGLPLHSDSGIMRGHPPAHAFHPSGPPPSQHAQPPDHATVSYPSVYVNQVTANVNVAYPSHHMHPYSQVPNYPMSPMDVQQQAQQQVPPLQHQQPQQSPRDQPRMRGHKGKNKNRDAMAHSHSQDMMAHAMPIVDGYHQGQYYTQYQQYYHPAAGSPIYVPQGSQGSVFYYSQPMEYPPPMAVPVTMPHHSPHMGPLPKMPIAPQPSPPIISVPKQDKRSSQPSYGQNIPSAMNSQPCHHAEKPPLNDFTKTQTSSRTNDKPAMSGPPSGAVSVRRPAEKKVVVTPKVEPTQPQEEKSVPKTVTPTPVASVAPMQSVVFASVDSGPPTHSPGKGPVQEPKGTNSTAQVPSQVTVPSAAQAPSHTVSQSLPPAAGTAQVQAPAQAQASPQASIRVPTQTPLQVSAQVSTPSSGPAPIPACPQPATQAASHPPTPAPAQLPVQPTGQLSVQASVQSPAQSSAQPPSQGPTQPPATANVPVQGQGKGQASAPAPTASRAGTTSQPSLAAPPQAPKPASTQPAAAGTASVAASRQDGPSAAAPPNTVPRWGGRNVLNWSNIFNKDQQPQHSSHMIPHSYSPSNANAANAAAPPSSLSAGSNKPLAQVSPFNARSAPADGPQPVSPPAQSSWGPARNNPPAAHANASAPSPGLPLPGPVDDPKLFRLGEFLHKYKLEHRAVSLQPRGLTNRSNWCYINATLQALIACPPFYNLMRALPHTPNTNRPSESRTPIIDCIKTFVNEFTPLSATTRVKRSERVARNREEGGAVVNDNIQVGTAFEPNYVYRMLNTIRSDTLVEGRQEDAEEFLSVLLNGLNDEMLELVKLVADPSEHVNGDANGEAESLEEENEEWKVMGPKNRGAITRKQDFGRTPISDIFRGQLRSRVIRVSASETSDNVQPFFTLQLDIEWPESEKEHAESKTFQPLYTLQLNEEENAVSVKKALEQYVARDTLEGLTCTRSNTEVQAFQELQLEDLPPVLLLHLKWFDYRLDGCSKICKKVEYDIDLRVDSKLLSAKKARTATQQQYKLVAVVYHDGNEATKGHYITDAYHVGYASWIRYDDSVVRVVPQNQVLSPKPPRVPYLLYYRRQDTIVGH